MEPLWLCRLFKPGLRILEHLFELSLCLIASPLACRTSWHWDDSRVLILLPPSEKKNQTTRATPAIGVYSGVLYQALGFATLSASAKARAQASIVIISAKYGAILPSTPIENYKEKIDNKAMRDVVAEVLDLRVRNKGELIIDCRSSTYKTIWRAPTDQCVEIAVSTVIDGERKVVTHMSKKTRGEITRWLVQSRSIPKTPEDLYAIVSEKYPCALTPTDGASPWVLEVIAI
jgi:cytoplasmic iron level regulating protein YaaA (DUF328/UPF0246 family)